MIMIGLFMPPIVHVAVADVDAAYGAYAAAENNTLNNTNNNANSNTNDNANHKNSCKMHMKCL